MEHSGGSLLWMNIPPETIHHSGQWCGSCQTRFDKDVAVCPNCGKPTHKIISVYSRT